MLIEPCPHCGKHEADKIKTTFPFGKECWLYGCPEVPEGWLIPSAEDLKRMMNERLGITDDY